MKRRALSIGWAALAVAVLVVALAPAESRAQGCAMCATYLAGATDARATGFKVSILFLMLMPFIVVGSAGGWILWMHWRSRPQSPPLRVLRSEREGAL